MPEIGRPESYYAREVHHADKRGDVHAREAYKVAQYVTLAMDPRLSWPQKLRYFQHALRRHCNPPPLPDEEVWLFYRNLAHLVREYAGREALRLASAEDDTYATRASMGGTRERIQRDAQEFFGQLMGNAERCPDYFTEEDWDQLVLLKKQWV
jgi:hypothetical protein